MRLIDPSGFNPQQYLDRRGITHAQLRALAGPRHTIGPMARSGVTLGPAAQVPTWRATDRGPFDGLSEAVGRGLQIGQKNRALAMQREMNEAKLAAEERQQQALGNIRSGLSGADA